MSYLERDRLAAEAVADALDLPLPEYREMCGADGFFDPWELFPSLYGSYSSSFDDMAILVLQHLVSQEFDGEELAHEMFREMLCTASLCEYGTSPRVCFPTTDFRPLVPKLIDRWKEYYLLQWGEAHIDPHAPALTQ